MTSTDADGIADVVHRLVEQHCPADLADAVLNDDEGLAALVQTCGRISGGDPASVSVILSEVADGLTPDEIEALLDHPAALADLVRTRHAALVAVATAAHPSLIDLDTGDEYEWITQPAGGGEPGYAHVDDHDWAWSREALAGGGARLAEVGTLDPSTLAELRHRYVNPPDED